jgi:hypothetical protein
MTNRKKRIWTWIGGGGLMVVAMTLALLWWSEHAPFKEGIIFDYTDILR